MTETFYPGIYHHVTQGKWDVEHRAAIGLELDGHGHHVIVVEDDSRDKVKERLFEIRNLLIRAARFINNDLIDRDGRERDITDYRFRDLHVIRQTAIAQTYRTDSVQGRYGIFLDRRPGAVWEEKATYFAQVYDVRTTDKPVQDVPLVDFSWKNLSQRLMILGMHTPYPER